MHYDAHLRSNLIVAGGDRFESVFVFIGDDSISASGYDEQYGASNGEKKRPSYGETGADIRPKHVHASSGNLQKTCKPTS